jgi:hypothetical protein
MGQDDYITEGERDLANGASPIAQVNITSGGNRVVAMIKAAITSSTMPGMMPVRIPWILILRTTCTSFDR